MKTAISKCLNYFNRFIQSDLYILFNSALIFIGWCTGAWVALLCVSFAIALLPLFLAKETKHLLVPLMQFTFAISTNRHALHGFAPLLVVVALLFAALIFNLIRFKPDFSFMHPKRIKGFHLSMLALIIPFALGGVGSAYEHPLAVIAALALVVIIGLGYTFLFATNVGSENKSELPKYMLKILLASGLLISLQLIVNFARAGSVEAIKQMIIGKDISIGWAGKNNVAPTIAMCIPAAFYFCLKKSKLTPLFAFIGLAEYALLFTTGCRGAILFSTLALPALILYSAVKSENKLAFCVTVCGVFVAAVVALAFMGEFVVDVLDGILGKGMNSAGRVETLYPEAFEVFRRWPIFGSGWDYRLGEMAGDGYTPYWYHSTAVQVLATMGVVGVISFAAFYFWRYKTFLSLRKRPDAVMLLAGLALFDAYGMIDTNFFGPTFFVMLMCITLVVEVNVPEGKCRAFGGRDPIADIAHICKLIGARLKRKPLASAEAVAAEAEQIRPTEQLPPKETDSAEKTE